MENVLCLLLKNVNTSTDDEWPSDRLHTMQKRDHRVVINLLGHQICSCFTFLFNLGSVVVFVHACWVQANFVTASWKEWLDQKGANKETNTAEEVEGIDNGPAFLRSQGKNEEDAVCSQKDTITEELLNSFEIR